MAGAQEDPELTPSHEQNEIYMYIGSRYSWETNERWMNSFWQHTRERLNREGWEVRQFSWSFGNSPSLGAEETVSAIAYLPPPL